MTSALTAATHPLVTGQRWVRRMSAVNEVLRAGAFDKAWFEIQTGQRYRTARGAVLHYLRSPRNRGLSPHPLFEPDYVDGSGRREALVRYLTTPRLAEISPHPMFDVARARRQLEEARPGRPVLRPWAEWAAQATADTPVPVPRGMDAISWGELRTLLLDAATQWHDRTGFEPLDWKRAAAAPRRAGLASVVLPVAADLRGPTLARQLLLTMPDGSDCEVVLAGAGTRAQLCCLRAAARLLPIVAVEHPSTNPTEVVNAGVLASGGQALVLNHPGVRLDHKAIDQLRRALGDQRIAIAQPLNQYRDTTVRSAGAYFPPGMVSPSPLFEGHPVEDGLGLGPTRIPAAYSAVVGVGAGRFLALGGFDPGFPDALADVDLSLRAAAAGLGDTWLVPDARAVLLPRGVSAARVRPESLQLLQQRWEHPPAGGDDLLARAGFRTSGHDDQPADGHAVPSPRLERLPLTVSEGRPRLRWAIDIAAPVGPAGDSWGDRHFARSLAAAFARLGQDVVINHREHWQRPARSLDDVVLALRGMDVAQPQPGSTNVMWIISHPDLVTSQEAAGFDLLFAAGQSWAADRSREWGLDIIPMLQCTDPGIFNPVRALPDTGPSVVFVGNSRSVLRPAVMYAIASGSQVEVYGRGWESLIPEERVMRPVIPNEQVGELYAGAGVVLNDHWEDMRRDGFLSNRLFDAVASGARVVSDSVPGLSDVFGDAVRLFETEDDMHRLLTEPFERNFLDRQTRESIAGRIAAEHSFDVRAEKLVDTVLEFRAHTEVGSAVR